MEVTVGATVPLAKVELFLECSHLPNLDTLSKSDPQVFVYTKNPNGDVWKEIGKTEIIYDNLNPKFSKSFLLDYFFEQVQPLKFRVVDIDEGQDFDDIGEVMTTLGAIVGSKGSELVSQICHPKRRHSGALIVRALTIEDSNRDVYFDLSAVHLDKKDFFGKSDPFLEIYRKMDDGSWVLVYRSEYILKTLNPHWRTFTLPLHKLNGGDMSRPIKISCWDWNRSGNMDFIGDFTTDLTTLQKKGNLPFVNEKKKKKKGYTNSGVLVVNDIKLIQKHTFLEYLAGGTEINLMVAIDYTASNGDPKYSNSLHYMNPYEPNEYACAIKAVGNILMDYDSDGNIPLYGFGAKLNDGRVSHCFHVNGQENPEVRGVDEVLRAYQGSFTNRIIRELYGPTNMATIIRTARESAKEMHKSELDIQAYLILLILTDGEITDMDDTIHEIVEASYLPMSIVIVGVGQADFGKMEVLDGDDERLKSRGRTAERDIVQFVPYREYKRSTPEALAAAVLAEIPGQFMEYMNQHKIIPHPPPDVKEQELMRQKALEQALITQANNLQHNPTYYPQGAQIPQGIPQPGMPPQPQASFYYPQGQGYTQAGYTPGPGYPPNMVYQTTPGQNPPNMVYPTTTGQNPPNVVYPTTTGQNPGENTGEVPGYPFQFPGYPPNMVYPTTTGQNPPNMVYPTTTGQIPPNMVYPTTPGQNPGEIMGQVPVK